MCLLGLDCGGGEGWTEAVIGVGGDVFSGKKSPPLFSPHFRWGKYYLTMAVTMTDFFSSFRVRDPFSEALSVFFTRDQITSLGRSGLYFGRPKIFFRGKIFPPVFYVGNAFFSPNEEAE